MQREIRGGGLRRRMLLTVLPAAVGAFGGHLYAKYGLDGAAYSRLAGMYAAAGAAAGILAVRLFTIFKTILGDYFEKKE